MMSNPHNDNSALPIKGYRNMTEVEVNAINRLKELGEQVEAQLDIVASIHPDARWLAIGRTNLQIGFMCVTRSIAKPETFA